jgi:hypothetical protein
MRNGSFSKGYKTDRYRAKTRHLGSKWEKMVFKSDSIHILTVD